MATPLRALERRNDGRREARREASRSIVVLRDGQAIGFAVTNISPHGIAGICGLDLVVGRAACFLFENGEQCLGQVRWRRNGKVGVYFARALSSAVLAGGEPRTMRRPRAPRFSTAREAIVDGATFRRSAVIRNVSIGGMMIETALPLTVQQTIAIRCGNVSVVGVVRWCTGSFAGIELSQPVDLASFEELSQRRRGPWSSGSIDAPLA